MKPAAVLLALLFALPWPLDRLVPDWVDRALYNPHERSRQAVDAYAAERWEEAAGYADQALASAPPRGDAGGGEDGGEEPLPDPRLAFNAGTARLAAGEEKRAVELLERATAGIDGGEATELAPAAHYNLGNARFAVDDADGAVAAYKQALRLDPDDADAKHNLELALQRLEEQRKLPLQRPQETPGGDRQGEEEEGDAGGSDSPADRPRDDASGTDPGEGDERRDDPAERRPPPAGEGEPQPGEQPPLPRYEDQPDMTAEQAAALLEAVENLERRQRQAEAAERARRRTHGGKDW